MRWLLAATAIFLTLLGSCSSQAIVPRAVCENRQLFCPGRDSKQYETYCCLGRNEYNSVVSYCCNPYVGLYIGLGVGIPLLIVIIVAVIMLYVCWSCYHRKQMRYLTRIYIEQTTAASIAAADSTAPPAYTPDDESKVENGRALPIYTEEDPFPDSSQPPPVYLNEEGEVRVQEEEEVREHGEERPREEEESSFASEETNAEDQPLIADN